MKKIIGVSLLALAAVMQSGCEGQRVNGSGNVSTETRTVGAFEKVTLKGSMDIEFTQGETRAVIIEAEDNLLPYIKTEVHDDELIVDIKDNISLKSHKDITVKVTAPNVYELSLAGSGNIKLTNTLDNEHEIKLSLAGSGNVEGAVKSPEIKVSSAGSGNIALSGETRDLDINMAGSGDFKGLDLHTENTKVTIAGAGNVDVHASVTLEARIMGSGDVSYTGSPEIKSSIAGSGSVHKRD